MSLGSQGPCTVGSPAGRNVLGDPKDMWGNAIPLSPRLTQGLYKPLTRFFMTLRTCVSQRRPCTWHVTGSSPAGHRNCHAGSEQGSILASICLQHRKKTQQLSTFTRALHPGENNGPSPSALSGIDGKSPLPPPMRTNGSRKVLSIWENPALIASTEHF